MTSVPGTGLWKAAIVALGLLACAGPAHAGRIHVKADATGDNNGSSWTHAYTDLQFALTAAASGDSIWVAAGTYRPTASTDRTISFQLLNNVAVLGGFAGTETSFDERDVPSNPTFLSGDIGVPTDVSDNSYHVVRAPATDATAVLDGFIVRDGNASLVPESAGAGLVTGDGSPTISNVVFEDNWAYRGAGCDNSSGAPTFINVQFRNNSAVYGVSRGGGISSAGGNPTFRSVLFTGNTSRLGGGFQNSGGSQALLVNCVFYDNLATDAGGTAGWGGGIYQSGASLTLLNCTFVENRADYSTGGLYNAAYGEPATATVKNSIFWENYGAGMIEQEIVNVSGGVTTIDHSLVKGCGGSGPFWQLASVDAGGNIDEDPRFIDQASGDLRLLFASPAMEAGDNAASGLPEGDFGGKPRIVGDRVDMGAHETDLVCPPGAVFYVDADATGLGRGTSWTDATRELRHALRVVHLCDGVGEVWVASGTQKPGLPGFANDTFSLMNGIALYGGFAGTETSLEERDWVSNPTILSGDIGGPGGFGKSYHVVTATMVDSTAVLDGFTISGGDAAGSALNENGGGMLVIGGNPTIRRVVFSDNMAAFGGGLCVDGGHPVLTDVRFDENMGQIGGGLSILNDGACDLRNAVFTNNSASNAGAIYNELGDLTLANAVFFGNAAVNTGGGVYNLLGGTITITNAVFHANTAMNGGGMCNQASDPVVTNTILWGNNATFGSEIRNGAGSVPYISHSLVEGSGGSGTGWDSALGTDGGGNIDDDPSFVDGSNGDFHLAAGSPAIDSGDNGAPALPDEDLDGMPRILGDFVDMGPYESYGGTGIGDDETGETPSLAIRSIYPNPFNPAVTIVLELDRRRHVEVSVYDVQGRRVRGVFSAVRGPGRHTLTWNALDDGGNRVASGVYFVDAVSESWRETRKVTVLK